MRRLYLSGLVSGGGLLPDTEIDRRREAFARAAAVLRGLGYEVVNPCEEPQDAASWADYMRRHIPVMCGCDAVVLLPGWAESRGAVLEVFIAQQVGVQVSEYRDFVHADDAARLVHR